MAGAAEPASNGTLSVKRLVIVSVITGYFALISITVYHNFKTLVLQRNLLFYVKISACEVV